MRVLLITGPAARSQGWGGPIVTKGLKRAIEAFGAVPRECFIRNDDDLKRGLEESSFDLIWSSLYFASNSAEINGSGKQQPWIPDLLDEQGIFYVGSNGQTMKNLLNKRITNEILVKQGIPVAKQWMVAPFDPIPEVPFPAIVKPCFESGSSGINEASVVENQAELRSRIAFVHQEFKQEALVEEYLPGQELTVSLIGNGENSLIRSVVNTIDRGCYEKYAIVPRELKMGSEIRFEIPRDVGPSQRIAAQAFQALGCLDHARVDMRDDRFGNLKIIEVNGIPGLDPEQSRSLMIHELYGAFATREEAYNGLIETLLISARQRQRETKSELVQSMV